MSCNSRIHHYYTDLLRPLDYTFQCSATHPSTVQIIPTTIGRNTHRCDLAGYGFSHIIHKMYHTLDSNLKK